MRIDNSAFALYMFCPQRYFERYEATDFVEQSKNESSTETKGRGLESIRSLLGSEPRGIGGVQEAPTGQLGPEQALPVLQPGIELDQPSEGRDFGTRFHQLLHERRCRQLGISIHHGTPLVRGGSSSPSVPESYPEWPDEAIEAECQATLAAYEAHYLRDLEWLESERTHVLPLPGSKHELVVKLDAVSRFGDGSIGPFDTKTENKPGYNTREDWAGKTQAKIYLYALEQLYPHERVSRLVVDIVTRRSPKAQRGPIFTRLDDISSSPEAIREAIRNVIYVADRIEQHRREGWWPANMNACKRGWDKCDFYLLHVDGRTEANLKKYRPAEQYLELP